MAKTDKLIKHLFEGLKQKGVNEISAIRKISEKFDMDLNEVIDVIDNAKKGQNMSSLSSTPNYFYFVFRLNNKSGATAIVMANNIIDAEQKLQEEFDFEIDYIQYKGEIKKSIDAQHPVKLLNDI
jgi:hypothetical protein